MRLSTLTLGHPPLIAPIASANALPPVRAGILAMQGRPECRLRRRLGASLECVFQSGPPARAYVATCAGSASISASPKRRSLPGR